jgi:hypothetical protein
MSGLPTVAKNQEGQGWKAIGRCGHLPFEDVDLTSGHKSARLIISAPVAEAELEHGTGHVLDGGAIEACALSHHSPDKAVETVHRQGALAAPLCCKIAGRWCHEFRTHGVADLLAQDPVDFHLGGVIDLPAAYLFDGFELVGMASAP